MKFDCGISKETKRKQAEVRLRERVQYIREEGVYKFAWLPVQMSDNDCRWLEGYRVKYPSAYADDCFICTCFGPNGYFLGVKTGPVKVFATLDGNEYIKEIRDSELGEYAV